MKRTFFYSLLIVLLSLFLIPFSSSFADNIGGMIQEEDGSPSFYFVKLIVSNGTLTRDPTHPTFAHIITGSGGGAGDITAVGDCLTGDCFAGNTPSGTYLRFSDGATHYTELLGPASLLANHIFTLPNSFPSTYPGILTVSTAGVMSFVQLDNSSTNFLTGAGSLAQALVPAGSVPLTADWDTTGGGAGYIITAKSFFAKKQSGIAGTDQLFNDSGTQQYGVILEGPIGSMSAAYIIQYPNPAPTTGQVLAYSTPCTWIIPALSSSYANQISFATGMTLGGIPYVSNTNTLSTTALLTEFGVLYGGGGAIAPATTANDTNSAHALFANSIGSGGGSAPAFRAIANGDLPSPLLLTGIIDGLTNITISTSTPVAVGGTGKLLGIYLNQHATPATAMTYNLPVASAGQQHLIKNSQGSGGANTGIITVHPVSGTTINLHGTNCTASHDIASGGAAGDMIAVVGVDATHWEACGERGTWACQ